MTYNYIYIHIVHFISSRTCTIFEIYIYIIETSCLISVILVITSPLLLSQYIQFLGGKKNTCSIGISFKSPWSPGGILASCFAYKVHNFFGGDGPPSLESGDSAFSSPFTQAFSSAFFSRGLNMVVGRCAAPVETELIR